MDDFEIKISENCVSETLEDATIILNIDTGTYHELNTTGTLIWNEIQNNDLLFSTLVAKLKRKFGKGEIESDVREFLQELSKKKILSRG